MLLQLLKEQGQPMTASPRSSPPKTTQKQSIQDQFRGSTSCLRWNAEATLARCTATQVEALPGCVEREMTNGKFIQRGGKTLEASRIFLNDTCLNEFDQMMSKRFSTSKWKQELTERSHKSKHELTHPLCSHLYMDLSPRGSGDWNFVLCRELLLVWDWD